MSVKAYIIVDEIYVCLSFWQLVDALTTISSYYSWIGFLCNENCFKVYELFCESDL